MEKQILGKYPEILEFFVIFSRMEYSLKACGFLIKNKRDAIADWLSFAHNIEKRLNELNNEKLQNAINYILKNPPKAQINDNGIIKWEDRPAKQGNNIKDLFTYIKRIRNNLFHGGKFNTGVMEDFDKDLNLVKNALLLLKGSIHLNNEILETFKCNFIIP